MWAAESVENLGVRIEAKLLPHCGEDIGGVHSLFEHLSALAVRFSVCHAAADTSASHDG